MLSLGRRRQLPDEVREDELDVGEGLLGKGLWPVRTCWTWILGRNALGLRSRTISIALLRTASFS